MDKTYRILIVSVTIYLCFISLTLYSCDRNMRTAVNQLKDKEIDYKKYMASQGYEETVENGKIVWKLTKKTL
jgi:hypothetical protein